MVLQWCNYLVSTEYLEIPEEDDEDSAGEEEGDEDTGELGDQQGGEGILGLITPHHGKTRRRWV